jgi:integrase
VATIARVPKASGVRYKAIIKRPGLPLVTKTFHTKSDAKIWARRMESDLERSRALGDPGLSVTLSEAAQRYLENYSGRDHHRRSQIKWWLDRVGHRRLSEIDATMIRESLRAYREGTDRVNGRMRCGASSNRMKAALSSIYRFAEHQGLAVHNPVRSVVGETESRHRIRYLSDEERHRLLSACRNSRWNRLYLLVLMAMQTGARKGELQALCWEDIDFARRTARLTQTKNGDSRVLSFPHAVVDELKRHKKPTGFVFESSERPGTLVDEKKFWRAALEESRVQTFRFHDLRHTAASYLAMAGVDAFAIAEVLGHRSLQTTKRYAHLNVAHTQALTDRVLGGLDEPGSRAEMAVVPAIRHTEPRSYLD